MLKISEFSKLTQVPTKTLRYYDELGLFKPVRIDPFTGYRYYSVEQVPRLNRLLALKALGLTLTQIAQILDDALTANELRGMLKLKRAETLQRLEDEQVRLSYVEAVLHEIEQEGKMSDYEVVLKQVEPQLVAGVRAVVPDMSQMSAVNAQLFGQVYGFAAGAGIAGAAILLFPDGEAMEKDIRIEAVVPVARPIPNALGVEVYTLPGAQMASVVHRGAFTHVGEAYRAILRWIEANGYHVDGASREVFLQFDPQGDPAAYVTEIQFPVVKG